MRTKTTRGFGLLEGFLTRRRVAMVERLISGRLGSGCILDIGCGSYPAFLLRTTFDRKVGLDKAFGPKPVETPQRESLRLIHRDLDEAPGLPLDDESCDVITMTAVLEHLLPDAVPTVLREIFRVLKPDGLCVITTPTPWTSALLGVMAKVGLVSTVEVQDHKAAYSAKTLFDLLTSAGFPAEAVRCGYFELGMNCWTAAVKSPPERSVH